MQYARMTRKSDARRREAGKGQGRQAEMVWFGCQEAPTRPHSKMRPGGPQEADGAGETAAAQQRKGQDTGRGSSSEAQGRRKRRPETASPTSARATEIASPTASLSCLHGKTARQQSQSRTEEWMTARRQSRCLMF